MLTSEKPIPVLLLANKVRQIFNVLKACFKLIDGNICILNIHLSLLKLIMTEVSLS